MSTPLKLIDEQKKSLFAVLNRTPNIEKWNDAIRKLIDLNSQDVTRDIVIRWVKWIAWDESYKLLIAETTADYLRMSPQAVLPLVDQFSMKLELDFDLKWYIASQGIPSSFSNMIIKIYPELGDRRRKVPNQPKSYYESQGKDLLNSLENRSSAFKDLKLQAIKMRWNWRVIVEKTIELLFQEELPVREAKVRERILKLLAEMSDSRFFDKVQESIEIEMKKELTKNAVPVMAALLPKETDINMREKMARILCNVSGPEAQEAIDALVSVIVGDERTRAARQELLAKYYLDPSKQRSEEAAQILAHAVDDARQTLRVLRWLNIIVFIVGILLLLTGTITAVINQELATRVIGGLAGLGGLTGIMVEMINSPLDRIQNAMANLVQIETAFTSFIWELNLNGTFIQSQYVAEGKLTDDEIGQTVKRIEGAMTLAMNQVSVYTKVGQPRVISRIYDVSPAACPTNSMVTVYGQNLTGDKTEKKKETGILFIDHKPIKVEKLDWKDQEVSFKLPEKINGIEKFIGLVWISLLVDGMETNALPFNVIE